MREPTFRRSRHTRQQRLLRTALGVVVVVAVAGVAANLLGGGDGPGSPSDPGTPAIAFAARISGQTDATKPVKESTVDEEGGQVVAILNDWYQRAFVDPELYGDGTFKDLTKYVAPEAQAQFRTDLQSLTIGDLRPRVRRVQPGDSSADVSVFFEKGRTPRLASVGVRFRATATLDSGPPLELDQRATYHFKKIGKGWVLTYWDVRLNQEQNEPTPTETP